MQVKEKADLLGIVARHAVEIKRLERSKSHFIDADCNALYDEMEAAQTASVRLILEIKRKIYGVE
jgi:hypothetical protein